LLKLLRRIFEECFLHHRLITGNGDFAADLSAKGCCAGIAGTYDYMAFYQNEINLRKVLDYPPTKKSARVLVSGLVDEVVEESLEEIAQICREYITGEKSHAITMLGPAKSPLEKIQHRWRRHLIFLADSWAPLAKCLQLAKQKAALYKDEPRVIVDMEPKSFL
jgi:primosomal protein N' (replication factor Y)